MVLAAPKRELGLSNFVLKSYELFTYSEPHHGSSSQEVSWKGTASCPAWCLYKWI